MNTISPPPPSISEAITSFTNMIERSRSKNTLDSYTKGLRFFVDVLEYNKVSKESPVSELSESSVIWFIDALNDFAPATERLYMAAVTRFYRFLIAENLAEINLPRMQEITHQRVRRVGQRLPQFPRDEIEQVVNYCQTGPISADPDQKLRDLRDRAFLIMLADTGLRVHEACNLRRGNVDWNEGRAVIIGKGDKEAVVRFSRRALRAIKDYLNARSQIDGASGRPIGSLPLFARHDKGTGKKVKPITTTTGRNIVSDRVCQILGEEAKGRITPHSFRHYFVTTVLRGSGNLKLAQELARHANISVTQRYAHLSDDELDKGYLDIFDSESKP